MYCTPLAPTGNIVDLSNELSERYVFMKQLNIYGRGAADTAIQQRVAGKYALSPAHMKFVKAYPNIQINDSSVDHPSESHS